MKHTVSIHVRMLPETILHGFEFLDTVNTFRILLGEDEA